MRTKFTFVLIIAIIGSSILYSSCKKEPLPDVIDPNAQDSTYTEIVRGEFVPRDSAIKLALEYGKIDFYNDTVRIFASKDTILPNTSFYGGFITSPNYSTWLILTNKIVNRTAQPGYNYYFVDAYSDSIKFYKEGDIPNTISSFEELRTHFGFPNRPNNFITNDNNFEPNNIYSPIQSSNNNHNWAVIISASYSAEQNLLRYWNDCSAIYRVLTNKYGYTDSHIFTLMSDGTSPGLDRYNYINYDSSPSDLDGDGDSDIDYAITATNLNSVFNILNNSMVSGDHLFIFTTGNGGVINSTGEATLSMWESDAITNTYFNTLLTNLKSNKNINICAVIGQGHAQKFNILSSQNPTVNSLFIAHKDTEHSIAKEGNLYTERLYSWISAAGEQTPELTNFTYVNSDINNNNEVSYGEISTYLSDLYSANHGFNTRLIYSDHIYENGLQGTWITEFVSNNSLSGIRNFNIGETATFSISNLDQYQTIQWNTSSGLSIVSSTNSSITVSNVNSYLTHNQWIQANVRTLFPACHSSQDQLDTTIVFTYDDISYWPPSGIYDGSQYIDCSFSEYGGTATLSADYDDCSNFQWSCSIPEWECMYQGYRNTEFASNGYQTTDSEITVTVSFDTPTGDNIVMTKTIYL